ncbi:hypothetical protein RFI_27332 [Reticulomyxa filosa]|uniref:Uncharacterized protein n=1 Tax=Reticulomyxa filosa TaxID=46433 RepID=X6MAI7_RETFI|nr:hypothetical protein RFI_27332 [Reticulomyxa filosa]|eukprot:ETO10050.1 hypothetical protein RFI_27332 [Reticulomyxa filosa]
MYFAFTHCVCLFLLFNQQTNITNKNKDIIRRKTQRSEQTNGLFECQRYQNAMIKLYFSLYCESGQIKLRHCFVFDLLLDDDTEPDVTLQIFLKNYNKKKRITQKSTPVSESHQKQDCLKRSMSSAELDNLHVDSSFNSFFFYKRIELFTMRCMCLPMIQNTVQDSGANKSKLKHHRRMTDKELIENLKAQQSNLGFVKFKQKLQQEQILQNKIKFIQFPLSNAQKDVLTVLSEYAKPFIHELKTLRLIAEQDNIFTIEPDRATLKKKAKIKILHLQYTNVFCTLLKNIEKW